MAGSRPGEATVRQLSALLGDGSLAAGTLVERLRELRDVEGVPVFSTAVHRLAHLTLPESQAEPLLLHLLDHRARLTEALGRDPGLAVTAVDYLTNFKKLLHDPAIVEHVHLQRTERSAITDALTGLYNRRYFMRSLDRELRRSRRYGLRLSLAMFDLDEFKALNDRHGHVVGDQVLQRVGGLLRGAVREADVACRFGGEEFAVILPETDSVGAYALAERVRQGIAAGFENRPVGGHRIDVRVSGGIASHPRDGDDPASLVERADQALYRSKCDGKDRVTTFHAERREGMRFPVRPGVAARVVGPELSGPVRVIDLSCNGALLEFDGACAPGARIELELLPADEALAGTPAGGTDVAGHVVRVEPRDGRFQIGVKFDRRLSRGWVKRRTESCRRSPVQRPAKRPA